MLSRAARRAAALILALAILAALAMMGTTFVRLAAVERQAAAAAKDHVHARMFAEGAVRFAIGRLAADGLRPVGSIDEAWVYEPGGEGRGGRESGLEVPIVDSLHPSYFDGVAPLGRDGREFGYSYAATLPRGLKGYATLRILDAGARIDVNAGDAGLARMLETLGALVDPNDPPIDPERAARVAAARAAEPGGRFASLADFDRALALPDGALARIGQFLVAWGPGADALVPSAARWPADGTPVARLAPPGEVAERRAAIDLNHASWEVLVALFAHVSARTLDSTAQDGRSRGRAMTTAPISLDQAKSLAAALIARRDPVVGGAGPLGGRVDLVAFLGSRVGVDLALEQAAALLANLDASTRTEGAGGPMDWPLVAKADLVGHTTEAAYGVSGGFEIAAFARILHGDRLVADELVEVDVDLLEIVRVTGQARLLEGTLERLVSYPEPASLPPATVHGAVGPAPLDQTPTPNPQFWASLAGRVDAERGGAAVAGADGARLLALATGTSAGEIHPDGVYSDGLRMPAWSAAGALGGTRGQIGLWFELDRRLSQATGPLYLPLCSASYLRPDAPPSAPDAPSYSSAATVRFAMWLVVPGAGADTLEQSQATAARRAELTRALALAIAASDEPLARALALALSELAAAEQLGGALATTDARPLLALFIEGADGDSELLQLARGDAVAAALRAPGWHHLAFHWDLGPSAAYEDALGIALDGVAVTQGMGPPRGYERLSLELVQLAPPALATSGLLVRLGEWPGRGYEPFDDRPFARFAALEVHAAPLASRELARRFAAGRYDAGAASYTSPVLWPGPSAVRWVRVDADADAVLEVRLAGTGDADADAAARLVGLDGTASDTRLEDARVTVAWRAAAGGRGTRQLVTGLSAARLRVPERIRRWQIGGTRLLEWISPEDLAGPPATAPTVTAAPRDVTASRDAPPGPPTFRASSRAGWVAPLPFDLEILARDERSRPVEGARALLVAGTRRAEATTDAHGRATFAAVPAGSAAVTVDKPGHRATLLHITSPGGGRALVVATLVPAGREVDPPAAALPGELDGEVSAPPALPELAHVAGELAANFARSRAGNEVLVHLDLATPVPDAALALVSAAPGHPLVVGGRREGRYLCFGPFAGELPPGRLLVRAGERMWLLARDDDAFGTGPIERAREAGARLLERLGALELAAAAILPELSSFPPAQRPTLLAARLAAWRNGQSGLEDGLRALSADRVAPPLGAFAPEVARAALALSRDLGDMEAGVLGLCVAPRSGGPPARATATRLTRDLARATWALGGEAATAPMLAPPRGDARGDLVARFARACRLLRLVRDLEARTRELAELPLPTRARAWPVLAAAWQDAWDTEGPAADDELAPLAHAHYRALAAWMANEGPRPKDEWEEIARERIATVGLLAGPRAWAQELVRRVVGDTRPRALSARLLELDALELAVPGDPPMVDLPGFTAALRDAIARLATDPEGERARQALDAARRALR